MSEETKRIHWNCSNPNCGAVQSLYVRVRHTHDLVTCDTCNTEFVLTVDWTYSVKLQSISTEAIPAGESTHA